MLSKASRLLVLVAIAAAMVFVAGLWWRLPAGPRISWETPYRSWNQLHVCPDGRTLLTQHDRGLSLWDIPAGWERARLPGDRFDSLVLSPDGRKVAFQEVKEGEGRLAWLWDPDTHDQPRSTKKVGWPVGFTPDSGALILSGNLGAPLRWDTITGAEEPIAFPNSPYPAVISDTLFPSGRLLRYGRHAPEYLLIHVRDEFGRGPPRSLQLPDTGPPRWFSDDGQLFAGALFNSGQVKVWDLTADRERATLIGPGGQRLGLSSHSGFSPDGRFLVTNLEVAQPRAVRFYGDLPVPILWDIQPSPPRIVGQWEEGWIDFSPDSAWLVVKKPAATLELAADYTIWQPGESAPHLSLGVLAAQPVFAPDGRTLVAETNVMPPAPSWLDEWFGWVGISTQPTPWESQVLLEIWDIAQRRQLAAVNDSGKYAYLPDGKTLVLCRTDGMMQLWDIPPRRPWWIEYGLPLLFASLLVIGAWLISRHWRRPAQGPAPVSSTE
jgi:WD40 repeat protein